MKSCATTRDEPPAAGVGTADRFSSDANAREPVVTGRQSVRRRIQIFSGRSPLACPDAGREQIRLTMPRLVSSGRVTRPCNSNRNQGILEIELSFREQRDLIFSNRNFSAHPPFPFYSLARLPQVFDLPPQSGVRANSFKINGMRAFPSTLFHQSY